MFSSSSVWPALALTAARVVLGQCPAPSPPLELDSQTCNVNCTTITGLGVKYERDSHAHVDDPFYTVPKNFSSSMGPGQLLSLEAATDLSVYVVPSGLTMSRIMYTTQDANGTILPASAYVLWPYSPIRSGGKVSPFQMVGWTHGTSGFFGACAPSNYRNLQYHFMAPFLLATQGMVVVAPDYAGLGVHKLPSGETIPHPWFNAKGQANDLAYAITAARAAFPSELGSDGAFVVMGHSQGGNAAWGFAERQAEKPVEGYKGTVVIAPAPGPLEQFQAVIDDPTLPFATNAPNIARYLIAATTAHFPAFNFTGLTPLARDRWLNVEAAVQGCLPTDGLIFADVPGDQVYLEGWQEDHAIQEYVKLGRPGGRKVKGPMLIISGEGDLVALIEYSKAAVERTCKVMDKKESLEYVTYERANHFGVIQASQHRWLGWIQDRFADKKYGKSGCKTNEKVEDFRGESTFGSIPPNFLATWVSPQEGWKYTL